MYPRARPPQTHVELATMTAPVSDKLEPASWNQPRSHM